MTRRYTKEDYVKLCEWWKGWDWQPVPEKHLPELGVVADECVAGFLYFKDSPIAWVEWVVSDPTVEKEVRRKALHEVLEEISKLAKENGALVLYTSTNKASYEETLKSHGFLVGDTNVTQLFKFLGE